MLMWKPPSIKPKPIPHKNGWKGQFCFDGKQYKKYIGSDERTAYAIQSRINNLIAEFKCGLIELPANISLRDFIFSQVMQKPDPEEVNGRVTIFRLSHLIDNYRSKSAGTKAANTLKTESLHLNHLQKFIQRYNHDPYLEDLDVKFFKEYRRHRKSQGVLHNTINKELATFQSMVGEAVEDDLMEANVVRDVKRGKSETPSNRFRTTAQVKELIASDNYTEREIKEMQRYRYLDCEEIGQLIDIVKERLSPDHWLVPIVITFACTGARRSELIRMRWADVDFSRKILFLNSRKQRMKVEEGRAVDMTPELHEALLAQKAKNRKEPWVFPGPKGGQLSVHTLRNAFKKALKDTDFEGIGFHCFRHSAVSNLAAAGVDMRIIGDILGHKTQEMMEHYRHLFPGPRKEAIHILRYGKGRSDDLEG